MNLAVSLHAANDELRNELGADQPALPAVGAHGRVRRPPAGQGPAPVVRVGAHRRHQRPAVRRPRAGRAGPSLPLPAHVNLIPLNPTPGYPTRGTPPDGVQLPPAAGGPGRQRHRAPQPGRGHRRRLRPARRPCRRPAADPPPRPALTPPGRSAHQHRHAVVGPHGVDQRLAAAGPGHPATRPSARACPPPWPPSPTTEAPPGRPGWRPGSGPGCRSRRRGRPSAPPRPGPRRAPRSTTPPTARSAPAPAARPRARASGPPPSGWSAVRRSAGHQQPDPLAVPARHGRAEVAGRPGVAVQHEHAPPVDPRAQEPEGPGRAQRLVRPRPTGGPGPGGGPPAPPGRGTG